MKLPITKHLPIALGAIVLLIVVAVVWVRMVPDTWVGSTTTNTMQRVGKALSAYQNACGRYPSTAEGLKILYEADAKKCVGYKPAKDLKFFPTEDGWKNPFIYVSDG